MPELSYPWLFPLGVGLLAFGWGFLVGHRVASLFAIRQMKALRLWMERHA